MNPNYEAMLMFLNDRVVLKSLGTPKEGDVIHSPQVRLLLNMLCDVCPDQVDKWLNTVPTPKGTAELATAKQHIANLESALVQANGNLAYYKDLYQNLHGQLGKLWEGS